MVEIQADTQVVGRQSGRAKRERDAQSWTENNSSHFGGSFVVGLAARSGGGGPGAQRQNVTLL
jgi:hypothetical protein